MGQTRLEIAPEVRHKVGLPSDDRAVTDEKVYRDINAGLRKMAQDYDWPWLVKTTTVSLASGSNEYTVPSDFVKVIYAAIDDIPLANMQPRRLQRYSQMEGYPRAFTWFAGKIRFFPTTTQDQEVFIAYVGAETYLADDTDEVLCPDALIDIVYTYAAIETATRLKDAVLRSTLKEELSEWKRRAADNVKPTHGTYAPNVERWW